MLSGQNLVGTANASNYHSGRATMSKTTGKWYWEVTATLSNAGDTIGIGSASASLTTGTQVGGDAYGVSAQENGYWNYNGGYSASPFTWTTGDVLGVAMDMDNGTFGMYKNGVYQGKAPYFPSGALFPMNSYYNSGGDILSTTFGQLPLKYTPPNGTFFDKTISGSSVSFTNNNLNAVWTGSSYNEVAKSSGKGVSTGKYYFEFKIQCANMGVGIANANAETVNWLGNDAYGWGYFGDTGNKYHSGSGSGYGSTFTIGDVIGVAVDMTNGKLYFAKNGTWQASGDPVAGTNPAFTGVTGTVYPATGNGSQTGYVTLNTGVSNFSYTPPSGYTAWDTTVYSPGVY